MKTSCLSLFLVFHVVASLAQQDSVRVFVSGRTKGEKYRFYFGQDLKLAFTSSRSYKYTFSVPLDSVYLKKPYDFGNKLGVYRKGRFSIRYRKLSYIGPFEPNRFFIFYRHPARKNIDPFEVEWSDSEPPKPAFLH